MKAGPKGPAFLFFRQTRRRRLSGYCRLVSHRDSEAGNMFPGSTGRVSEKLSGSGKHSGISVGCFPIYVIGVEEGYDGYIGKRRTVNLGSRVQGEFRRNPDRISLRVHARVRVRVFSFKYAIEKRKNFPRSFPRRFPV